MNLNGNLNIIDLTVGIFIFTGCLIGMIRGFIKEISGIISLTIAGYFTYYSSQYITTYITEKYIIYILILIIIFTIIYGIVKTIIDAIFANISYIPIIGLLNRVLGAILGGIKTFMLVCIGVLIYINNTDVKNINPNITSAKSMTYVISTLEKCQEPYERYINKYCTNNHIIKDVINFQSLKELKDSQLSVYHFKESILDEHNDITNQDSKN